MSMGAQITHDFVSRTNGRDYRLTIWQPPFAPPAGGFPVVWVLDGAAYFGLVTDMVRSRSVFADEIEAAVVVGVGYPTEDLPRMLARRSFDFTPTVAQALHVQTDHPADSSGGLDGFLDMFEHEAVAVVAQQASIDRDRMAILGHSLGGLAVLHALFTRPTLFQSWVALSPSIWWDDRIVLRGEQGFADKVRCGAINPRIFIGVGANEQSPPDRLPVGAPFTLEQAKDWNARARMVDNAAELATRLGSLTATGDYTVRYLLADGESHATLPFAAARAALDLALGQPDTTVSRLDALFAPFDRADMPGLVVGVARDGQTLYRRGLGLASIEHGVKNDPAMRMRIGSTSKQFASLAALLLADEGKLDVDAAATDLLPELRPLRGVPTLRQFMNHTSGYRCRTDLAFIGGGMSPRPAGSLFETQISQGDVNFAPGQGQLYCNGGYHLLSLAIERAAGVPFGQVLKQRIFAPLGMADTELAPNDMRILPRMATMHIPVPGGGWQRGLLPAEDVLGEGGIISTVDDMLAWLAHLRRPEVVGDAQIWAQMIAATPLQDGSQSPYGLGLYRFAYRGVEVITHGGGVPGGSCAMLTVPEYALDIVMMGNGGPANLGDLQFRIIDALLDDVLSPDEVVSPRASDFGHLLGHYYHAETGALFAFNAVGDAVGDTLGVALFGLPPAPILRDTGATLQAGFAGIAAGPFVWAHAALLPDPAGGPPDVIDMSETGRTVAFARLPASAPSPDDIAPALVGAYRCDDLDGAAHIRLNPSLALEIATPFGRSEFALEPLSDRVLIARHGAIPGFTMVMSVAIDGSGFHLTGPRTRHLRCDRVTAAHPGVQP